MKQLKDVLESVFAELEFTEQKNANKNYYYPVNDGAKALLEVMKRKALVENDIPKLKDFAKAMASNFEIRIKIISQERRL